MKKHTEFQLETFSRDRDKIIDAFIGGILLIALLASILFIFSLFSI